MRHSTARIDDIEGLFDWFVDGGNIYWKVWPGSGTSRNALSQNVEEISLDQSWEKLKSAIERQSNYGGESFKILTASKPNSNYGLITQYVNGSTSSITPSVAGNQSQTLPFNSIGSMLPGGIPGYLQSSIAGAVETANLKNELNRANEKIDELEYQLEQKTFSTPFNELKAAVLSDPAGIMDRINVFIGMMKGGNVQTVAGGPEVPPQANQRPTKTEEGKGTAITQEEYDIRFQAVAERINEHINVLDLLERIDQVIHTNPKVLDLIQNEEKLNTLLKFL